MSRARVIASRIGGLFRRKQLERQLDEELRFHIEMQIDDNLQAGMPPNEARYAALRQFGAMEPMKETYRDRSAIAALGTFTQDVRYSVRTLRKSPGFTITAVTTLALAIGASTAMFSVLNTVLLRPLPFRSPEQLAMLWTEIPSQNLREGRSAYWNADLWRRESRSFEDIAVFDPVSITLTTDDHAERVSALRATPNYFQLLGLRPVLGRVFTAEEAQQRQRVAVISHRLWQSRFGGSGDVIGASIVLDGRISRIVGVLPSLSVLGSDLWEPHTLFPDWENRRNVRGADSWFVMARLRPNVTIAQAQEEMSAIARRLDEQLPAAERNRGIRVAPLDLVGVKSRRALWLLTAAVFCVLLIAAVNVASLSLARSVGRAREIAIRATLGASPLRVVRQLLVENVTLAILSGVLGAFIGWVAIDAVRAFAPGQLARLNDIALDPQALAWVLGVSLLTGVLVGLAPAAAMWRRDLRSTIQASGSRSVSGGAAASGIRRVLVISEFALAIVLLTGAGLLIRSWQRVERVDPGFNPARILSIGLRTPSLMPAPQRANFYERVLAEIRSVPGVESAGFISDFFIGSDAAEQIVTTEGAARSMTERVQFRSDEVGGDFFQASGIPLLRGRFFLPQDTPAAPRVAIVSNALARRLWPGDDPVGRRFKLGPADSRGQWFTVVGVVGDIRRQGLETEPVPSVYEAVAQNPSGGGYLLVRTSIDDPMALGPALQSAVLRVDKHVVLPGYMTLGDRLGVITAPRRFQTSLIAVFAAAALLLAAIGIYGLIQYSTVTRTQEIGIRIAIGSQAGQIFRMVIGEGLKLSLTGVAFGLVGAFWIGKAGASLLFGVSATDPVTFLCVPLLLTAVAVAACYFPARRAMKVDPVVALRQG